MLTCWRNVRSTGVEAKLRQEFEAVHKEGQKKIEKLQIATDAHIGLEMLHAFILDLLGRDTPAAIIFRQKTDEDFRHTRVVTRSGKVLAGLMLLGVNAFFAYYSVLKCYVKGSEWQYAYVLACAFQLLIEMLFFETLECIWINCMVPSLVSKEVGRVNSMLLEVAQSLCVSGEHVEGRYFLNVAEYLYVSSQMAKGFPELLESVIIRSYHSHLPGELSKKWTGVSSRQHQNQSQQHRKGWHQVSIIATLLLGLQLMATSPFVLQKVVVRFIQPFMLGGIVLLWNEVSSSPIHISLFVLMLASIVVGIGYKYFLAQRASRTAGGLVKSALISPHHSMSGGKNESKDAGEEMSEVGTEFVVLEHGVGHVSASQAARKSSSADLADEKVSRMRSIMIGAVEKSVSHLSDPSMDFVKTEVSERPVVTSVLGLILDQGSKYEISSDGSSMSMSMRAASGVLTGALGEIYDLGSSNEGDSDFSSVAFSDEQL